MKKMFFALFLILSVSFYVQAQNADYDVNNVKSFVPTFNTDYLTTAVWNTLTASPHAQSRSFCAAIKRGDTIFVYQFGGGAVGAQQQNVARYNKLTGVWTNSVAVMPFSMSAGSAVTMPGDSIIYIIGGTNGAPAVYGKCIKYNIITNTFTTMADMTTNPCTDQLSVRYRDSLIFCIGGGDGLFGTTIQYNSVRIYNTKSNTWTTSTSLPITLSMSGGGIYGDTIIVASGASGGAYVANAYKGIINPSTLAVTWTAIPVYPGGAVTRMASYFVKVGSGGGVLCTGGAISGATLTSATYLWNFCTQSWQTLTNNTLARSNYKGCGFGDSVVYCVAGYTTVGVGQFDKITFSQIDGSCFTAPVSNTWIEQTSGLTTELNSVSAVSDMVCWASGAAGKVVRTINSGSIWTNVSGDLPTTNPAYVIWGFDANNAVLTTSPASGAGTRIFKTTNGGTNWVQTFFQSDGWGDGLYFLNANTGFFYGDHTGTRLSIFKTTNGGTNWDSTGMYYGTTSDGWNNAMFGLGNQIWIGTNSTTIVYSSNAGVNWVAQTTTAANQYAIWFNSATVGMAGGPSTATWKTTNSGTNWAVIGDSIANNCTGLCGYGSEWWQTTFLPNVYYSSNDGASWATQYIAPAGNFRHITKARTGSTLWGVRTNGGISRYGSLVGVTPINTPVPSDYSLMQNYPNPFNPVTKINYSLPKTGLVMLKIYNVLGQEVATLVNEVKTAGNYFVDFDATNFASGIYFYTINSGNFTATKRMMFIK